MLSWLRSIFTRRKPSSTPAAPPSRTEPQDAGPAADAPVAVAPRPRACPAEVVEAAAAQVLDHFRQNQPGPESFPGNAARIIDVIQQRDPNFNKLVQIVGQDVGIAARLLQVANSALYSHAGEVQSVRAAAMRLGFRTVGEIALGCAGRTLFETDARQQYQLFPARWEGLFHASMTGAFAAAALSLSARVGQSDRAFLAGMLHDVGKPIALRAVAALHLSGSLDERVFAHGIEAVLERVHVDIGAAMTETWSLPEYLRAATRHHHDADVPAGPDVAELHVVRVVDALHATRAGALTDAGRSILQRSAAAIGLATAQLRVAGFEYAEHATRVSQIFSIPDPLAPPAPVSSTKAA